MNDLINGTIELLAGMFVLNHCRVLFAHKQARGVSLVSVGFFTLWGIWNLYYYPALNQPISFFGAVFIVAANAAYLGLLVCYRDDPAQGLTLTKTSQVRMVGKHEQRAKRMA